MNVKNLKIDGEKFYKYLYGNRDRLCKERDRVERIEEKWEIMRRINLIDFVIAEFERSIIEEIPECKKDEIPECKEDYSNELRKEIGDKAHKGAREAALSLLSGIGKSDDYREGLLRGIKIFDEFFTFIMKKFDLTEEIKKWKI